MAKQVKKASLRSGRRRRVEVLATSSVITDKLVKHSSDEQLANRFGHTVSRIRQVRYAVGFFRVKPVNDTEVKLMTKLAKQHLSYTVIAQAMGRGVKTVRNHIKALGMASTARHSPSRIERERINNVLQSNGLPTVY